MVRVDLADFTSYGGGCSGRLPFRFFFHERVWSGSFRLARLGCREEFVWTSILE